MKAKPVTIIRSAFSLTELVLAIALVLLLMLGVVSIFKNTTDAIGKGMAVGDLLRVQRGASNSIPLDFQGFKRSDTSATVKDASPMIWIRNEEVQAALDKNNTALAPHRVDMIGFMAYGSFKRQTANRGSLTADAGISSSQAYIWYGHNSLPDLSGAFPALTLPVMGDASTNPSMKYARNWILGRAAILLRSNNYPASGATPNIQFAAGSQVQDSMIEDTSHANRMAPLSGTFNSSGIYDTTAGGYAIYESRYDIGSMHTDGYTGTGNPPDPFAFFRARVDTTVIDPTSTVVSPTDPLWYASLLYRFQADPNPTKPIDSTMMGKYGGSSKIARTYPILLPNCSDFRVEYAGDFCSQVPASGAFSADGGDGIIDYVFDPATGAKKIRWYGLATADDPTVNTYHHFSLPAARLAYERSDPDTTGDPAGIYLAAWGNAASTLATDPNTINGPERRPRLLRITCTIHDSNARLVDGQKLEFIVQLKDQY